MYKSFAKRLRAGLGLPCKNGCSITYFITIFCTPHSKLHRASWKMTYNRAKRNLCSTQYSIDRPATSSHGHADDLLIFKNCLWRRFAREDRTWKDGHKSNERHSRLLCVTESWMFYDQIIQSIVMTRCTSYYTLWISVGLMFLPQAPGRCIATPSSCWNIYYESIYINYYYYWNRWNAWRPCPWMHFFFDSDLSSRHDITSRYVPTPSPSLCTYAYD